MSEVAAIHRHLLDIARAGYPRLTRVIQAQGPLFIPRRLTESLFIFLARTMAGQSPAPGSQPESLWPRLIRLIEEKDKPRAEEKYRQAVYEADLSQAKTEALLRLSELFANDGIDRATLGRGNCRLISQYISGLRGFDHWSQEMTAIFYLGLPDIWPGGDEPLNQNLRLLAGEEQAPEPQTIAAQFAPFRSYLALHLWRYQCDAPQLKQA